jgi:hypothetical protein
MVWFLPEVVRPRNSIWLLGAFLLWLFVLPSLFRGRWRIDVLRVQLLYSFAHAFAIFHIATGRTQEWVATGAARRSTPLSVSICRIIVTYLGATLLLTWAGLARGVIHFGLGRFWVMLALAAVGAYIQLPVLKVALGPAFSRGDR